MRRWWECKSDDASCSFTLLMSLGWMKSNKLCPVSSICKRKWQICASLHFRKKHHHHHRSSHISSQSIKMYFKRYPGGPWQLYVLYMHLDPQWNHRGISLQSWFTGKPPDNTCSHAQMKSNFFRSFSHIFHCLPTVCQAVRIQSTHGYHSGGQNIKWISVHALRLRLLALHKKKQELAWILKSYL